jgi:biopolymer transport protein ExbD
MAGGVIKDEGDFNVEPNVIPFVDIMLVLMIVFIITIPVMTHAVKLDLPQATNKPTVSQPETISVSIDFDGQVYWNQEAIGGEELLQYILTEAVKEPQPEVHIRADKRVRYEYVATVLFALQRGGMRKVGFIAEPVRGPAS